MGDENENIDRKRVIGDYEHSILQSVEHDEAWGKQAYSPGYDKYQQEWNAERSKQLDENEAVLKQQYDEKHCEEVTGLDSNGYRHQVISDRVDRQMAEEAAQKGDGDLKAGYWEAARVDAARGAAAEQDYGKTSGELQSGRRNFWAEDEAGKSGGGTETEAGKTMAGPQQTDMDAEKSNEAENHI
jgi:hypothetical protein